MRQVTVLARLVTPSETLPMRRSRLKFLDSARGVAALIVLLHHAYATAPFWPEVFRYTPLRIFLTARAAVIFFFVLSGFVLAYAIWVNGDEAIPEFPRYAARRFLRIYLPYAACAVCAFALYGTLGGAPILSLGQPFNDMWSTPPNEVNALGHLLLLGTTASNSLNVPAWSLVYELRISILVPLLCFAIARQPRLASITAAVVFLGVEIYIASTGLGFTPYATHGFVPAVMVTAHFAICFVVGIILARVVMLQTMPAFVQTGAAHRCLWFAACAFVLVNRDAAILLGSAIIIYLCTASMKVQSVLNHRALLWLGRISFSLYLTHMVVLEAVVRTTYSLVSPSFSIPIAVLFSVVVAWAFYEAIERPAHILSKTVAQRSKSTRRVPAGLNASASSRTGCDGRQTTQLHGGLQ